MERICILFSCEHFHYSLFLSHQLVRVFGVLTQKECHLGHKLPISHCLKSVHSSKGGFLEAIMNRNMGRLASHMHNSTVIEIGQSV